MFFRGLTFSCFEKECQPLSIGIKAIVANYKVMKVLFILFVLEISTVYSILLVIY